MLEEQMSSLGISTLFGQKNAAETAESKRLSRTDSDSLLSIISQDLEESLQQAFNLAAAYVGKEPPKISIDRDFDTQSLDGAQVGQYLQLWSQGAITHETLLGMLKRGEILSDIDVDEEVEMVSQEKASSMVISQSLFTNASSDASSNQPETEDDDDGENGSSSVRQIAESRLKALLSPDEEQQ